MLLVDILFEKQYKTYKEKVINKEKKLEILFEKDLEGVLTDGFGTKEREEGDCDASHLKRCDV